MAKRKRKHGLLGSVDLLGLNSFGNPIGMSPIFGAAIGGGVSGLASMTAGHISGGQYAGNREAIGLGAGLLATGVLWSMHSTRHASLGSLVGTLLASGLPFLEKMLLGTVQLPVATAAAASAIVAQSPAGTAGGRLGVPRIQYLNGLGIPQIQALNGGRGGLGMATIAPVPQAVGTIPGVHGPNINGGSSAPGVGTPAFAGNYLGNSRPPISLLGPSTPQGQKISLMGGPAIHGLSANYGATLLGGGR